MLFGRVACEPVGEGVWGMVCAGTGEAPPDVSALLAQWAGWVRALAYRNARRTRVEPDDLYAEIVLAILADFAKYDPRRAGFATWVALVARHVCRDIAIRESRQQSVPRIHARRNGNDRDTEGGDILDFEPDRTAPCPVDEVIRRERQGSVGTALATLTAAQREAVRVRFWTHGARLNHSGQKHLRDALATLRQHLADPGGGTSGGAL